MKILKKILSLGIMSSLLFLTGCQVGGPRPSSDSQFETSNIAGDSSPIVKINSLTASEAPTETLSKQHLHKLNEESGEFESSESFSNSEDTSIIISEESSEAKPEDKIQYIVIYKSVKEITFTIKLDNPEAVGIDAVRLYCDDENAKIQVDGEYKPLAYESDNTRVVNWASEDAYEKTYFIQLSSEEYLNTLAVKDIRLAGHSKFQSKEVDVDNLGKNELRIYKMDDIEFSWLDISNTTECYTFSITTGEKIKNFSISADGLFTTEEKYKLNKNSLIIVDYDYSFDDGLTKHIHLEKNIELIKFTQLKDSILEANALRISISGTLMETVIEIPVYDNEYNHLATLTGYSPNGWYTEQWIHFEDYGSVIIEFLGAKYSINTENQITLLD